MVGAVKPNFVPLESESANVPKCAQVHGVPTSRIANVKHGPESCLVEAVRNGGHIENPGVGLTATNLPPRTGEKIGTGGQIRRS